jgi:hypothetical protein
MERARKAAVCKARTLFDPKLYAVFFYCALTFAHLALCAAAILFLPAADIVRLGFDA